MLAGRVSNGWNVLAGCVCVTTYWLSCSVNMILETGHPLVSQYESQRERCCCQQHHSLSPSRRSQPRSLVKYPCGSSIDQQHRRTSNSSRGQSTAGGRAGGRAAVLPDRTGKLCVTRQVVFILLKQSICQNCAVGTWNNEVLVL